MLKGILLQIRKNKIYTISIYAYLNWKLCTLSCSIEGNEQHMYTEY